MAKNKGIIMTEKIVTTDNSINTTTQSLQSEKKMLTLAYALQAAYFLGGISFLVAVIISYIQKEETKGTWLESHCRWQIRTFWFTILWATLGFMTLYLIIGFFVLAANAVWVIYRIVKGWSRLSQGKEMYV